MIVVIFFWDGSGTLIHPQNYSFKPLQTTTKLILINMLWFFCCWKKSTNLNKIFLSPDIAPRDFGSLILYYPSSFLGAFFPQFQAPKSSSKNFSHLKIWQCLNIYIILIKIFNQWLGPSLVWTLPPAHHPPSPGTEINPLELRWGKPNL